MSILVSYYSRSGNTKKLAMRIAQRLNADIDEIVDLNKRKGIIGFLNGGKDAATKKLAEIKYKKYPYPYDIVVVGTPVWAGNMAPAVRTYLKKNKFKKVAFFCTYGGSEGDTFNEMAKISKKPEAMLGLRAHSADKADITEFLNKLRSL